jgi:hypothetical protein
MMLAIRFAVAVAVLTGAASALAAEPGYGVFPGARADKDGALVLTRERILRQPGTSKERSVLPEGTRISLTKTIKVRAQSKTYEVQMWEGMRPESLDNGGFGDAVAVLAVLPEGAAAPTDVAEVKADRETYLDDKPLPLGSDDAFAVSNAHLNAGEDFHVVTLFHLRDGRLRRIATENEFSAGGCAEPFVDRLRWRTGAQAGPLPNVIAEIETIHAPKEVTKDCEGRRPKERRTLARHVYRWDAGKDRYVAEPAKK